MAVLEGPPETDQWGGAILAKAVGETRSQWIKCRPLLIGPNAEFTLNHAEERICKSQNLNYEWSILNNKDSRLLVRKYSRNYDPKSVREKLLFLLVTFIVDQIYSLSELSFKLVKETT